MLCMNDMLSENESVRSAPIYHHSKKPELVRIDYISSI